MADKQRKSGGDRKHGRNDAKCNSYRVEKTREKNKLKRVLKSSGIEAATKYADTKEIWGVLRRLTNK
jgi:hypothetical protein